MTYFEIMQQPGREIHPKLYYYDSANSKIEIDQDDIENVKMSFNGTLTGTVMQGLEVTTAIVLPTLTAIYFQNTAKYDTNHATKTYGPYFIKESSYNADDKTYDYTLYDDFLNAMVDYKPITINYPTTVLNFFKQLCTELGYTTSISSLPNGSRVMSMDIYDGIGFTYRDIFDDIGHATATLFKISNKDVQKCILGTDEIIVDDDLLKNQNISLGEHFGPINSVVLSRAGESDNIYKRDETSTSWNEWKIVDNQLMNDNNRSDYLDELYNALYGIEYDIFDLELVGYGGFDPLAKVKITTNGNTFNSFVFNNEIEFNQGVSESIYTELPEQSETDYKSASDTDKKINQTYIIANKNTQQIQSLVSQVGDRSEKQTTITQDIDSISQQVSQSITLTKDVSNISYVTVEDAFESNVSKFSIVGEMSLLYPSNDLYPSDDLYPLDSYLIIENEDGNKNKVLLPLDYLHYLNANAYDEFVVENSQAKIIRRVGEADDGSLYALTTETVEDKGTCEIQLNTGYNKLYLESFSDKSLRYDLKYVYQNDYTDTFATKVELNSSIEQTATEINLEVSKKVDENEIISAINLTSETAKISAAKLATIKADNIELEGLVTANNNFKVLLDGSIEATNGKFSGTVTATSGKIGTWDINSTGLVAQDSNGKWTGLRLPSGESKAYAFFTGATSNNGSGATFIAYSDGSLYASNATIVGNITATSGTFTGTINASNGTIAGFNIGTDRLYYGNTAINRNGNVEFRNDNGYFAIGNNSVNLHGNGMSHPVTISDMLANSGTGDVNASIGIRAYFGNINISSNEYTVVKGAGGVYINDQFYSGSSSIKTKKNLKSITNKQVIEIYDVLKNLEIYQYDYKSKYGGRKDNIGFLVEDIEGTVLEKYLHVYKDDKDKNRKSYNNEDLIKAMLIALQELMKRVDKI